MLFCCMDRGPCPGWGLLSNHVSFKPLGHAVICTYAEQSTDYFPGNDAGILANATYSYFDEDRVLVDHGG